MECAVALLFVIATAAIVIAAVAMQRVAALERRLQKPEIPRAAARPAAEAAAAPLKPPSAPRPPPPPRPQPRKPIDWESIVGVKLFSWIGGIAFVLAAIFLFKLSIDRGWLRPPIRAGIGLATGMALLIVCEMRIARGYKWTANAMIGAGIATLYATLFAMHARWHLWPAWAVFAAMLLVTAAAVYLSTRRDSVFIALLGLLGGFATPALLSTGENRPLALFSYLLLLNGGLSWVAYRKRWPALTALSVLLTVVYQWGWVAEFLDRGQLPLAAAIFVLFAAVAASALWARSEERAFERIATAGASLPLLFALFTAIVPEYGARFHVLFGFLLLIAIGLAAIAILRGPEWLHRLGAAATVLTWFVWLLASYTGQSWPWTLAWLAAFIALYLLASKKLASIAVHAAGALFFVFGFLAVKERSHAETILAAMLVLLAFVGFLAPRRVLMLALGLAYLAVIAVSTSGEFVPVLIALVILLGATFVFAEPRGLVPFAVPLTAIATYFAADTPRETLLLAGVMYAMFTAYPLILGRRVGRSNHPHLAATLAAVAFFYFARIALEDLGYGGMIGLLPVFQACVAFVLLWRLLALEHDEERQLGRAALVAATVLAFITIAIPLQFEKEWITIGWALEAAALAWLFNKIPHRGLLYWTGGLAAAVLLRLVFNPQPLRYVYLTCAAALFVAAWLAPRLRAWLNGAATIILFTLLNIEIDDHTFASALAENLTYTIGWALFAIAMLVAGIILHTRTARVAALGLLLVTVLKCFLFDLAKLGGLYRVASLFGLAVSLVLVGVLLQRFVMRTTAAAE